MRLKLLILTLACACFTIEALGQGIPKRDTSRTRAEAELENLLEQVTQDAEDSQLLDLLARLQENPLDINEATAEELQQLPGITSIIAFNIISFRARQTIRDLDDLLQVVEALRDVEVEEGREPEQRQEAPVPEGVEAVAR
ncbi:MAG: helix-hairpin-helix domain-containing protein, partial [Bacteroidota bacterium]